MIRYMTHKLLKQWHLFYEPAFLIGAGRTAERVLRFYQGDLGFRYDIVGIIDDAPISESVASRYLLYGNMDDAETIIRDSGIKTVIIKEERKIIGWTTDYCPNPYDSCT